MNKLRTILVAEEDLNFMNKLVFGIQMMRITRESNMYLELGGSICQKEIKNGRGRSSLYEYRIQRDEAAAKNGATVSVDETNC